MFLPQCCGRVPMGRAPSLPKKGRDGRSFKCFVFNDKSVPMSCLQWPDAVETIWMTQYQCKHGVARGVHHISYACLRKDVFGEVLLKVSYSDTHSAWGCASQTPHAKVTLVWVFIVLQFASSLYNTRKRKSVKNGESLGKTPITWMKSGGCKVDIGGRGPPSNNILDFIIKPSNNCQLLDFMGKKLALWCITYESVVGHRLLRLPHIIQTSFTW